ncbi:MAG: zinc-ribbon domain-containing protein [Promethearchaeota archaeon]
MSITNNIGYCNHCQQNVLLKRKEFDVCLAIILVFFTAGIGLLIYLAIYHSKPPDRCVHCNSLCFPQVTAKSSNSTIQNNNIAPKNPYIVQDQKPKEIQMPQKIEEEIPPEKGYCGFCGEEITPGTKFCPSCGTKL